MSHARSRTPSLSIALSIAITCAACGGSAGDGTAGAKSDANATTAPAAGTGKMATSTGGGGATPAASMSAGKAAAPVAGMTSSATASGAGAPAMTMPPAAMSSGGGGAAPMMSTMSGTGAMPVAGGAGASGMMIADDPSPMPSPGCMGGSLKAGRTMGSIQSSGGNRTFIQYIPTKYDGNTPVPLVVDLHPYSVGASYSEMSSGFRQLADSENYMYIAPQGMSNMWDSTGDTDEKFIRDLVNDVSMKGCIDLRRIYATGCSNGGAFSFLLMCTAEDIFAAVAPMCGTAFFDLEAMCMMDRPVSLMLRIGKQDTLNCWEGEGMALNAPNVAPGTKIQCAKTVEKIMGDKYHCKGTPKMMAECEYLGDCDQGTEIAICDENTGHVVYQPNTAKDTWAFLKQFYKH